jgi:asparagine synthetase B (glutamine-hydrolysing)
LRSDRSAAYHSLEVRLPFCDPEIIDYIFSLPYELTATLMKGGLEKSLLREAFAPLKLIPESIRLRDKEAMSDAVSQHSRSWYQVIQEYIETLVSDEEFETNKTKFKHNTPLQKSHIITERNLLNFLVVQRRKPKLSHISGCQNGYLVILLIRVLELYLLINNLT